MQHSWPAECTACQPKMWCALPVGCTDCQPSTQLFTSRMHYLARPQHNTSPAGCTASRMSWQPTCCRPVVTSKMYCLSACTSPVTNTTTSRAYCLPAYIMIFFQLEVLLILLLIASLWIIIQLSPFAGCTDYSTTRTSPQYNCVFTSQFYYRCKPVTQLVHHQHVLTASLYIYMTPSIFSSRMS